MIRTLATLSAVALLGLAAMASMAAPPASTPSATEESSTLKDLDARVASLRSLPADERRAQLKAMAPEERRTLWNRLHTSRVEERGSRGPFSYDSNPGTPVTASAPSRAVGAIQYDDGLPTIGFGGGAIVGNRFNTHTGNPLTASGTVSTVQALLVPGPANTTSSAGFVLLGPQTGGGGATALFSTFTGATGVVDTVSWTGMGVTYTGSSFFVLFGDFASVYIPVFGTGTNNGQGHHGVVGYTGGMGPNITSTFDFGGALNSVIRARGNILPVELISFDIE